MSVARAKKSPKDAPPSPTPLRELAGSSTRGRALLALDDLADLPLKIEVPLDTISVSIRGLLDLAVGSVLQLDRITGETFDVTVNGTAVAKGEIRVHGERFAIRITEILHAKRLSADEGEEPDESPLARAP
jgi:flagellar motor switch protein FliN/FliY